MANSSNSSNQQIEQLKKQIADGTEETKTYLSSLQGKVADYDKEHKLSDTASSYMQAGMDKANWSVNELKDFGARFKNGSEDISDEVLTNGRNALRNLETSLSDIKTKAGEYDTKTRKSVNSGAASTKSSLESLVDSARTQGNSWFDSLSKSFESLQSQISANATAASNAASNAADTATTKVASADRQTTGGVGADIYNKGAELVNQASDYVASAFQSNPADKTTTTTHTKP